MIKPTVPDIDRPRITPAQAAEHAYRAHHLVNAQQRRTPLRPVTELRCSCGSTLTSTDEDKAFDLLLDHCLDAVDCFCSQLSGDDWLMQLIAAASSPPASTYIEVEVSPFMRQVIARALGDDRVDGMDRQLADQAALGDVR